jgi:uncharacterized protein (TIGR03437 family)
MDRVLLRAGLLIFVVLTIALSLQWAKFTAGASPREGKDAIQETDPPLAQLARLIAEGGLSNDAFGVSVAVSGDTLVAGAIGADAVVNSRQGAAYVFVRSSGVWVLHQKITAPDGATNDGFGRSVAISGDSLVVCSLRGGGEAYVFARSEGVWRFQQKLKTDDVQPADFFGVDVALHGNVIVIGAPGANQGTSIDQGAVYVFVRSETVWSQPYKLFADDGAEGDQFGYAVAASDGMILVGSPYDAIGANTLQGSAYVYAGSGSGWTLQQKLTAKDSAADAQFGVAVAASGETVLIGAPGVKIDNKAYQGAAYLFVRSGSYWSQQQTLTAGDGAANDYFGVSAAIDGDQAFVGASHADVGPFIDQGAAYLFSCSGGAWTQRQKLTSLEGVASDRFGRVISLDGDAIIVGDPDADIGSNSNQGAVYLFGCGYIEQQRLVDLGGANRDFFGAAAAIDGDTSVIGAPADDVGTAVDQGSAFVFMRRGSTWTQTAQLFADDGAAGDAFGAAVSISGDYIVVGAHRKNINGVPNCGAAYVFARNGDVWIQQARLVLITDYFGYSVAISGDRVAIGAPVASINGRLSQGLVYLYTRFGSTWTPEGLLTAVDGATDDQFGSSVALAGDLLISGAPGVEVGPNSNQGAAYVFQKSDSSWRLRAKLIADDGAASDQFGRSVALFGQTALVGAPLKRFGSTATPGAGYVFVGPDASKRVWSQQARLINNDRAGSEQLGYSVALGADTAVLGAIGKTVAGRTNQGAALVFTRAGSNWALRQSTIAGDGSARAQYGSSAAVSGDTIVVGAVFAGSNQNGAAYVMKNNCGPTAAAFASVSAASYSAAGGLAPESIAAGFGSALGNENVSASSLPLPTTLGGLTLKITDSAGVERPAPLFFVSPGQLNYLVPPDAAIGPANLKVVNSAGPIASGRIQISRVAPGVFSANAIGQGPLAGFALRIKSDGSQFYEPIAQFDSVQNRFVPVPIDLGPPSDQVFLGFFGAGLRFRSSLAAVRCVIGGENHEALYAGAAPEFVGIEQVNVRLSRALIGRGEVDVALTVDGKDANTLRVHFR